ncbi:MAG: tetratricopeptide repeat protein [Cytophagaceae bacterium]|nr:tetratricopeptide repeat protein [Cytophagaceae bacterium]
MLKQLLPLYLLLVALFVAAPSRATTKTTFKMYALMDDEYDRLKKSGDSLFVRGEYERAKFKYESILLVVPGYEEDAYAKGRIELSQKAITLRKQASDALSQNKGPEAIQLYQQVLVINPSDPITKGYVTEYWSAEGNKLYNQKKYREAKTRYQEALRYAPNQEYLQIQLKNIERFIGYKPLTGLKIAVGVVGIAAAVQAVLTRSGIQTKLDDLNALSTTVDPDGDGEILTSPLYDQWRKAYDEAKDAKAKESMVTVYAGVAAVAVVAETILLLRKPKRAVPTKGLSWQPAARGVGLSVRYTF